MPPGSLDTAGLPPRDGALAVAIHRLTLQRWLTLAHLADAFLKKPLRRLEPAMQGVLLTGAAQLVFMDRLPTHAVVDESVSLARRLVRPKAAGMANAVLRRIAALVDAAVPDLPWTPARDRLPLGAGSVVLTEPCLPDPADRVAYWSVVTSCPTRLVQAWFDAFGFEEAAGLLRHGLETPPTIVVDEHGAAAAWTDTHAALTQYLDADPRRRVQDPASAVPVDATAGLDVRSAYDPCAGRGTKTRQLAALHPAADVWADDPDDGRAADLAALPAIMPKVRLGPPPGPVDLLLLDVPCSNTGVLARRPEARYRYRQSVVRDLVALQQQIADHHLRHARPGGHVLYATCSIEPAENQGQARWLAQQCGGRIIHEALALPAGRDDAYHDGGYHALIRLPDPQSPG